MFRWFVVVAPWEQAIRVRSGKHVRLLSSGLFLRLPFIDRVYRQSTRRRISVIPAQSLTTLDGRAVTLGACIGYEIVDLLRLYKTLHNAADTIESEVCAWTAAYVAGHTLAECRLSELEAAVRARMTFEQYGLGRPEFFITNFVAVRTLRLITGEIKSWTAGTLLDTTRHDGENHNL